MNNQDLDNVLQKLSLPECVMALTGLSEQERKALSERALQWLTVSTAQNIDNFSLPRWQQLATTLGGDVTVPKHIQQMLTDLEQAKKLALHLPPEACLKEAIEPSRAAVFATCTLTEIKKHEGYPTDAAVCYALLMDRRPRWTEQWARYVLEERPQTYWKLIRRLENETVIALEANSVYFLGMVIGMPEKPGPDAAENIARQLRQDQSLRDRLWPMLEDDDVTRIFTHDLSKWKRKDDWQRRNQLRGLGAVWSQALALLAEDGTISRLQLLHTTVAILTRLALESSEAASKMELSWFSDLHNRLSPTPEEDSDVAESYIRLLYSRNTATVDWIITRLKQMVQARSQVPLDSLCSALEAVFLVKGKANAIKALDCLSTLAQTVPEARGAVGQAALGALENNSQDVQKGAISLIEKYCQGETEVAEKLRDNLERVAIVYRQRAQDWLHKQNIDAGTEANGTTGSDSQADATAAQLQAGSAIDAAQLHADAAPDLAGLLARCDGVAEQWQSCAGIKAAAEAIVAGAPDLPALQLEGTEYPRLNPDKPFQAVEDFDGLVFLLAKLMRNYIMASDAEELERLLDAVARLATQPPDDYLERVTPLQTLPTFGLVGGVVELWLKGDKTLSGLGWGRRVHPIDKMLEIRCDSVGKQARSRTPGLVLSTPTHQGGWIDPLVLVERVLARPQNTSGNSATTPGSAECIAAPGEDADIIDQSLSMLRLAPENRSQALAQLIAAGPVPQPGEFINALRYALGDSSVPVGSSAPLWIAAARARAPFADDEAVEEQFPGFGPDGGRAAQYQLLTNIISTSGSGYYKYPRWNEFKLLGRLPNASAKPDQLVGVVTAALHQDGERDTFSSCPFHYRHWASTICPIMLEAWFAHSVETIARNTGDSSAAENAVFIEKLYDPDLPLKQMALLTLALALSSKHKAESGPALEALIQTIEDGRLNSGKLAGAMNALRQLHRPLAENEYALPLISLTRWSKAAKTAALTSPYHTLVIRLAIEQMLTGDPSQAAKDLHAILEVLLETSVQQQQCISNPELRQYLSGIKTSGKTEKLLKQLLALKKGPQADSIRADALAYALERRINRAQRWQSWQERNAHSSWQASEKVH